MTIKELKQQINDLPDNMQVFMNERQTDFKYGLVNSGEIKTIKFSEEPDADFGREDFPTEEVFVLSEE